MKTLLKNPSLVTSPPSRLAQLKYIKIPLKSIKCFKRLLPGTKQTQDIFILISLKHQCLIHHFGLYTPPKYFFCCWIKQHWKCMFQLFPYSVLLLLFSFILYYLYSSQWWSLFSLVMYCIIYIVLTGGHFLI